MHECSVFIMQTHCLHNTMTSSGHKFTFWTFIPSLWVTVAGKMLQRCGRFMESRGDFVILCPFLFATIAFADIDVWSEYLLAARFMKSASGSLLFMMHWKSLRWSIEMAKGKKLNSQSEGMCRIEHLWPGRLPGTKPSNGSVSLFYSHKPIWNAKVRPNLSLRIIDSEMVCDPCHLIRQWTWVTHTRQDYLVSLPKKGTVNFLRRRWHILRLRPKCYQ